MPSYSNRPPMRSSFDAQLDFLSGLAAATLDALRQLNALHLRLARQVNDDAMNAARVLLAFGAGATATATATAKRPPAPRQPE
jgi:hypothetical protein